MNYSFSYVILVASYLIIAFVQIGFKFDEKSLKYINGTVWLSFLFFFGFRGFIGWDWYSYYPFFSNLKSINHFEMFKTQYDIGFDFYSSLIKTFTNDYHVFVFVSTLIDGILLHFVLKKYLSNNLYALAFALFVAMEGVILEINLMRNIKGLLLFLLSIQYIENRSFLKFFLLNLLGFCFHWSSVIFFPLYFFIHKRLDLRLFFAIFIVGNIIYLAQIEYVTPLIRFISQFLGETIKIKTEVYMDSSLTSRPYGITLGYLERVGTSLIIMLFYKKLSDKSTSNIIFVNSFIVFFVIYFYFSEVSIILTRLGNLFIFSYWIIWPKIIELSSSATKYILIVVISVYLCLKISKTTENILYKYDNVLIGEYQSFNQREKIFIKNSLKLQMKK